MTTSEVDRATVDVCRATIARGSKSFALASRLLPPQVRDASAIIYSWCRHVNDAIDHSLPSTRAAKLDDLRAQVDSVYSESRPADAILAAFQQVVRTAHIPRIYADELIAGMEMDVLGAHYRTMADLELYCYRVAGTVGLMMCHVMGVRHVGALHNAAHLGMAMQLTNICRDIYEDWSINRLYIPDELLERHGAGDLRASLGSTIPLSVTDALSNSVRRMLHRADDLYTSGDRGLRALDWRCALAIRSARLIYAAIGDALEARDYDLAAPRAVVPLTTKLRLIGRAVKFETASLGERSARWRRRDDALVPASFLAAHPARPEDLVRAS